MTLSTAQGVTLTSLTVSLPVSVYDKMAPVRLSDSTCYVTTVYLALTLTCKSIDIRSVLYGSWSVQLFIQSCIAGFFCKKPRRGYYCPK